MTFHFTPVWFIAIPLLLAFLAPLWVRWRVLMPVLFSAQFALFALALSWLPTVRIAPVLETIVIAPPLGIHLHLDTVALLFVTLFSFAGAVVSGFIWLGNSAPHLRDRPAFILILLLIAGSNGMVLTGDIFNLYVFIEIVGVSAYALAALRRDKTALEGGLKYLIVGSVAAIFILFAIVLLYLQTGQLNIAALARAFADIPAQMQLLIGLLMLIGLGIKAELFPFNFWVPDIYRGSDSEITALYSGVLVKAFLFVLFHLTFILLADPTVARNWLMALGAITMIVAELVALRQQDLRRMLAYSSLGQVGLITLALAFASEMTTAGALFHVINHTLIKLLLFLLAALMLRQFASLKLADLQGLSRTMPIAAGLFVLAALAVLGLPPLSGFVSKLWILKGFSAAQTFWPIALILIAALIEAGYYFRWIRTFYAPTSTSTRIQSDGERILNYAPLLLIAGLLIVLGVMPFLLEDWLTQAAQALLGREALLNAVLG
ncbi:sodium:proton antiporter [Chromatium weissei]|nr:sodium:proton antiporter [Chromatium weissei]